MTVADEFAGLVGADHVLTGARLAMRNPGWCHASQGAGLLVRPADTAQVAAVVRLAGRLALGVVAQGGLTGLVEGTQSQPGEVIVSFERMNRVLAIDPAQGVVVVEPGVRLADLDAALAPHGVMIGVDIGARDSCTIGGMVATNAGGIRVLRHGMMRHNVLGLEVVLASGAVLDLAVPLVKNNAGYDLKQVFIGSEGTLGLVTRIALRLWPRPQGSACAMIGLDPAALAALVPRLRAALGDRLSALEGLWPDCYAYIARSIGLTRLPLAVGQGLYMIVEATGADDASARDALEAALTPALENGTLTDAVIAQSQADRAAIWRIRESGGALGSDGALVLSYDIGLRLADLDVYVTRLRARAEARFPGVATLVLGHVGDGNLHVMFPVEKDADRVPFDSLVYGVLAGFSGSTISAEHGIGLEKRAALQAATQPEVLSAMRALKLAFDPENRLNPGKVL